MSVCLSILCQSFNHFVRFSISVQSAGQFVLSLCPYISVCLSFLCSFVFLSPCLSIRAVCRHVCVRYFARLTKFWFPPPPNNVVSSSRNLYINFLSYTLFKRYYDVTPACYFCILLLHVIVFSCCCMLLLRVMLHILIARSCCMLFHTSEDISFFPNNVSSYM